MRHLTRYQNQWPARPVFQDEIKQVHVEAPGEFRVSSAEYMLSQIP
jgi:hypothetical protein